MSATLNCTTDNGTVRFTPPERVRGDATCGEAHAARTTLEK